MAEDVIRSIKDGNVVLEENGEIVTYKENEFYPQHKITSIIRLQKEDFVQLNSNQKYLTHFNLQCADHDKGEIYALPLILKHGHFDGKKEILPVLSFKSCLVVECVEIKEHLNYDELTEEDFKYSFNEIKNVDQLKKAILRRYEQSLPNLTEEKLISLGISVTKLKILHTWEEHLLNL